MDTHAIVTRATQHRHAEWLASIGIFTAPTAAPQSPLAVVHAISTANDVDADAQPSALSVEMSDDEAIVKVRPPWGDPGRALIPPNVLQFTSVKKLTLERILGPVPDTIGTLTNLVELRITDSDIDTLPNTHHQMQLQ